MIDKELLEILACPVVQVTGHPGRGLDSLLKHRGVREALPDPRRHSYHADRRSRRPSRGARPEGLSGCRPYGISIRHSLTTETGDP